MEGVYFIYYMGIYIEKIHSDKSGWRINLPPHLCRGMNIIKGDQFLVYAIDVDKIILTKVDPAKIIENGKLQKLLKLNSYGKQTNL